MDEFLAGPKIPISCNAASKKSTKENDFELMCISRFSPSSKNGLRHMHAVSYLRRVVEILGTVFGLFV